MRVPAAAHLARVPPQPNSTSSGWAPIASATPGTSRLVVISGTDGHTFEVDGIVDVPPEGWVAQDAQRQAEPAGFGAVAGERARPVGEGEPAGDRHARHVG